MPRRSRVIPEVPTNNTVKLAEALRTRVAQAMRVEGFTVWAEFCRVALTEKCQATEKALRERDPDEFETIYGRSSNGNGNGDR